MLCRSGTTSVAWWEPGLQSYIDWWHHIWVWCCCGDTRDLTTSLIVELTAGHSPSWCAQSINCAKRKGCQWCVNSAYHKSWVLITANKGSICFEPPLSQRKSLAIQRLGFGVENKVQCTPYNIDSNTEKALQIIVRFASKFWPDEPFLQCTDSRFRFLNLDYYGDFT